MSFVNILGPNCLIDNLTLTPGVIGIKGWHFIKSKDSKSKRKGHSTCNGNNRYGNGSTEWHNSYPFSILYALGQCSLPIDCCGHLDPLAWSPRSLWVGQLCVPRGTFVQPEVVRPRSGTTMGTTLPHLVGIPIQSSSFTFSNRCRLSRPYRCSNSQPSGWRSRAQCAKWKPNGLTIAPLSPVYPCEVYSLSDMPAIPTRKTSQFRASAYTWKLRLEFFSP